MGDYIHRVGRTARAGRSGRAVTFVSQYDVELYQRIEHLLGKKLPVYPTEESEVLLLSERVMEEKRKSGKKRKNADMEDAEESMGIINRISGKKKQHFNKRPGGKKMKKR